MSRRSLAIIGGGPFCTYALERLAALLPTVGCPEGLSISIFDRTGRFGAGATHSDTQAATSYMNRVASQIAFAADESNAESPHLLPRPCRPTFAEWSQARYRDSGDERYNLAPEEVPHRYLHGEALREMFGRYVTMLQQTDGITVDLYSAEVTDISREDESTFNIHVGACLGWSIPAHYILLVTGHSNNDPAPRSVAEALDLHARTSAPARYVSHAYPLEEQLTGQTVPAGRRVAILGLGLTAVDALLHLTEGRGGTFVPDESTGPDMRLEYVRSGREPSLIVAVSPSGTLTSCRPRNAKATDGTARGHSALEHKGVFLTIGAIQTLRRALGTPTLLADGEVRQLDFELHVFPLVVLEMAYVYYKTLFGEPFGSELRLAADSRYRSFLVEGCASRDAGIEYLLAPVQERFERAAAYVRLAEIGADISEQLRRFSECGVFEGFLGTVYGESVDRRASPWGHSPDVYEHRFDWRSLFQPLGPAESSDGADWQNRVIAYMRRDHLAAAQGNLRNPVKAACDGVWRDLRAVFSEAVDFGGLTARSHRRFIETYLRFYGRMSNGTGLECMSKILALIEAGLVDVSVGPAPAVEPVPGRPLFRIGGGPAAPQREVSVVVEGRTHPFDTERDAAPLYPNLFRRGLVRRWRNPGRSPDGDFYPGGLDVTRAFHPVQSDGTAEPRLTILGAPIEGVAFFQLSAARPQSNSAILNNISRWANEFVGAIRPTGIPSTPSDTPPLASESCAPITAFRSRIRSLLAREGARSRRRDVVILAIDGIPYELARSCWRRAQISKMRSVFPTTSSTAWLSSLTGADVGCHGVPGVVFRAEGGELINVFEYRGRLEVPPIGNIFSDAADLGYCALSITGDWEPYDCTWRDVLLRHSEQVLGFRFYTAPQALDPLALGRRVLQALAGAVETHQSPKPRLVWCFIDADRHIHRHGYDEDLVRFLRSIEEVALELARQDAIVIAHSDHGLTRTNHSPAIQGLMEETQGRFGCVVGGAGRTRWIYPQPGTAASVLATLKRSLPSTIRVYGADEVFGRRSLARARVGEIVLVADGEDFMTFGGHRFDHGASTEAELLVPFAQWNA